MGLSVFPSGPEMNIITFLLSLTLHFSFCLATSSTDDWTSVDQSDIYRDLDPCAQSCVRNVNERIWDVRQGTNCRSYGCVCSESTQGENFLNGLSNVTSCALKFCSQLDMVDSATNAFGDLCLVFALNSTIQPAKSGRQYFLV